MRYLEDLVDFLVGGQSRTLALRLAILSISIVLGVVGVLFVYSTTADEFESFPNAEAGAQIAKVLVGLLVLLLVVVVDFRFLERFAYTLYVLLLLVLAALLAVKRLAGGEIVRWISIGFLNIQPSELMKVVLILALARYLRFRKDQRRVTGLARPFLITVVPMVLVVTQPDLGTSLMLPPILLALLFVAGARRKHLAVAIVAGLALFPSIVLLHTFVPRVSEKIIKDYQVRRLTDFVRRDEESRSGGNWQLDQSIIAVGSGGLTGKGYHQGTQNRNKYLPAKQTDFIFAIIGEELGLLGAGSVVLLYLSLIFLTLAVAFRTREPFARLVVTGVAVLFTAQGFVNFGMTLGLTPITGLPLPFVSYGGSSLVTSFLAVGLVISIASRPVRVVASPDLNPEDEEAVSVVIDDHPAGANQFPNSPY